MYSRLKDNLGAIIALTFVLGYILFCIASVVVPVWVACHFIAKYW